MQKKTHIIGNLAHFVLVAYFVIASALFAQLFVVPNVAWADAARHAILVGEENYAGSDHLNGPLNDVGRMQSALSQMEGAPYDVTTLTDTSKSRVLSAIRGYQPSGSHPAGSNDVTLFYYSGHGLLGDKLGSDARGSLCCMDSSGKITTGQVITPQELATELGKIRGRIVVLLDSCYSGSHVAYAQNAGIKLQGMDESDEDACTDYQTASSQEIEEAMGDMIAAFKAEEAPNGGISLMSADSKFYVMSSSSRTAQSMTFSVSRNGDRTYFGLFTYYLLYSAGFNYVGSALEASIPADTNDDRKVTFAEAFEVTQAQVEKYAPNMDSMVYPRSSDLILFDRSGDGSSVATSGGTPVLALRAQGTSAAKPLATSLKKIVKGKRQFVVTWKKMAKGGICGYQIRYSHKKTMSGAKLKTVKSAKTTKLTVKKLKKGKKYYVQVRTYKIADGKKVYSSWSSKRSVTVK